MSRYLYKTGLRNVGSYQVSGHPYLTGSNGLAANSEHRITFPFVTKAVTVINHSNQLIRIHFNSKANPDVISGNHYLELDNDEDSFTFSVKCSEIYISTPSDNGGAAKYRLYAELTNIPDTSMYALSGSGLTDATAANNAADDQDEHT